MPNRFLSLTPIAALLFPLGASAVSPITITAPMCGNEPMPVIEAPYKVECALDHGISVNSAADQGDKIRAALTSLVERQTGLFFPQGRYIVRGELNLRSGNSLVGSALGPTQFMNPDARTSLITQTFHSAHNILVEGLLLDNIGVQLFHDEGSVVRYNALRMTRSPQAQINLVKGANRVYGNVLVREPEHPGLGILARSGVKLQVAGNLIGRAQASAETVGVDGHRVDRLQRQVRAAPLHDGSAFAPASLGNYTRAVDVTALQEGRVDGNVITLTPMPNTPFPGRHAIVLQRAERSTVRDNRLDTQSDTPLPLDGQPLLELQAPQSLLVQANVLSRVGLLVTADSPVPTKGLLIEENLFDDAMGRATQRVTGDSEQDTTPADILFTGNRFQTRDLSDCLLSAMPPSAPDRTFGERDNLRVDTGEPVKTCYLRHLGTTPDPKFVVPLPPRHSGLTLPGVPVENHTVDVVLDDTQEAPDEPAASAPRSFVQTWLTSLRDTLLEAVAWVRSRLA